MSPFTDNPFAPKPPPATNTRDASFGDLFDAKLTAKTQVAGLWLYSWTEQTFDPADGAYTDANPARSGSYSGGNALSPAQELNNTEVDLTNPVYVSMRQKGFVGGQMYYEFACPANAVAGSSGTSCTGCGWLEDLQPSDCLQVSVLSAVGACACASDADSIYLASNDAGTVWGTPGGGGSSGGGGGGGGGTVDTACCAAQPTTITATDGTTSYTLVYLGNFGGVDVWQDLTSGHALTLSCSAGGAWTLQFGSTPPAPDGNTFTKTDIAVCVQFTFTFTNDTSGHTYTVSG